MRALSRIGQILFTVAALSSTCWAQNGLNTQNCYSQLPLTDPNRYFRWRPASITYTMADYHADSLADDECPGCGETWSSFNGVFAAAVATWCAAGGVSASEGNENANNICWIDNADNVSSVAATTTYGTNSTTNSVVSFDIQFFHYVYYAFPTLNNWHCSNECLTGSLSMYDISLHEFGHALGLAIRPPEAYCMSPTAHPSAGAMAAGVCNIETELTDFDKAAIQFLYTASSVSRVAHFSPVLQGGGVAAKWQSKYEYETAGFVLEKKQPNGSFAPISEPIMPAGSAHGGADYEYFDPTGTRSDIYRLMEVDRSGIVLGTADEGVLLKEPSPKPPIVLSDAERTEVRRDIAAMLEKQIPEKDKALKAPMSGETTWLAIYPAAFSDNIAPLITYRNCHGYNASGIAHENILSQYGTIKAYLQYLWNAQAHALKYVVIVGDDTQIPAEHCTDGDVGDFYASYLTDVITVDLTGDWFPELSVGRIPAASADEVSLYVAKVLEYEGQAAADWNNHITYFIDDRDGGFSYQSGPVAARFAEELAELIPPTRTLHYENMLAHLPYDQCSQRSHAINEFDAGRGTVLAFGSTASEFSLAWWLRTHDIYEGCAFSGSQLSQNHKYAFVLGAGCDIGNMNASMHPWLLKELLFQRYSGAIACFAPTGATWQLACHDVSAGVINHLYNWGTPTVGYACHSAQKDAMAAELPGNAHSARSFIFFGDPAIKLKGSITGATPVVTVTDPNGGESYSTPGPIHITWDVQDDDLAGVRCTVLINYSGGSGIWSVLATGVPVNTLGQGSYNYHIGSGNITYTHCLVKVFARDACNNEGIDVSDGEFTVRLITPPPKPGEPIPIESTSAMTMIPKENYLGTPFPNPFNPVTTIGFGLKEPSQIVLTIYNVSGAVVKSLCKNELLKAGTYTRRWDGTNDRGALVSSGIYFLQMKTESYSETRRLILLR